MISLCVPTRGRPEQFASMVRQARHLATGPIEIVARIDSDDVRYPELEDVTYVKAPRSLADGHTSMSALWTEAWRAATGSIAMLCGDDAVFCTSGWDAEVEAAFETFPDRIGLVYANDLSKAPRPIMPFVSREWIEAAGQFTPEGYPGWYADTWLWHIAADVRRIVYLPTVAIRHEYHEGADQTYRDGEAARAAAGGNPGLRAKFLSAEETAKRRAEADRLRAAMTSGAVALPRPIPPWLRIATRANVMANRTHARAESVRLKREADAATMAHNRASTVVTIHCYAGDRDQVENGLYVHRRHGAPVVVVSPTDAPVKLRGVDCIQAGLRGYTGRRTMDRQREQLRLLLDTYPQEWFLLNDADSFCMSPEIPAYLYARRDVFWSNEVPERRPHRSRYPKIAFHPPYFAHRMVLERLLTVDVEADPHTPFIDWYMMALAVEARVRHRRFPDGKSMVAWRHGKLPKTEAQGDDFKHVQLKAGGTDGASAMAQAVRRGANLIHAVKHPDVLQQLVQVVDAR